jgi:hypothetical protein
MLLHMRTYGRSSPVEKRTTFAYRYMLLVAQYGQFHRTLLHMHSPSSVLLIRYMQLEQSVDAP